MKKIDSTVLGIPVPVPVFRFPVFKFPVFKFPVLSFLVLVLVVSVVLLSSSLETRAETFPRRWTSIVTGEHIVGSSYHQGLVHLHDGWVFSTNDGLYRTNNKFEQSSKTEPAIPPTLSAQGYNHIGDIDVDSEERYLWAPIECGDKKTGQQVMARYEVNSLKFVDSFTVPQHHNSFVTLDHAGVVYSTDWFDDDTVLRYQLVGDKLKALAPLKMSRKLEHIQGGDIADGALWLSTDDKNDRMYRVNLDNGEVQELGSIGHTDGECEGIDATPLASGLLHVLSVDAHNETVRVIDAAVNWSP